MPYYKMITFCTLGLFKTQDFGVFEATKEKKYISDEEEFQEYIRLLDKFAFLLDIDQNLLVEIAVKMAKNIQFE